MLLIILALAWVTTLRSFEVSHALAGTKLTGMEIVSILGAIHVPVLTLMGYAFKNYCSIINKEKRGNED